jgi:hypothetical protein
MGMEAPASRAERELMHNKITLQQEQVMASSNR